MAKSRPPTTGQFRKGDGRRRGPPPLPAEVREAFRAASPEALETLRSVMRRYAKGDENTPASAAVSAASAILDRAWGKAPAAPEDLDALRESGPLTTREKALAALEALTRQAG